MKLKMKSLFRLTATLATWLSTTLGVLALPMEEVSRILQGVPVFTIVDADGAPLVAKQDDGKKTTGVFISQQEANAFLQELRRTKPDVAAQLIVQPVALGEVVKISESQGRKADPLSFAYVPLNGEVENARRIPGNEYQGGVPLFVARGGDDASYLTIDQDGNQIIPFFLKFSQIKDMVARFKQEQPTMANTIVIDVIAMENVISTLQSSNDEMLKQMRIVPTQEAVQFINSSSSSANSNILAQLPSGSCPLTRSIYKDVDGDGFELSFSPKNDGPVSSWAIATLRQTGYGARTTFTVNSRQGGGGTILSPNEKEYSSYSGEMRMHQFSSDLKSPQGNQAPDYILISGLGSFDWYWNKEKGEPFVGDTMWKFDRCK